jgi:hypothetical protein
MVAQVPLAHTVPAGQALPQRPQFAGSLVGSRHLPRHEIMPGRQRQAPMAQLAFAPQLNPQAPQLA